MIQLPLATTQLVSATERHADEQRLDRRILVIDDNQDAANTTAMLIEEMGEMRESLTTAKALSRCSRSTNRR